MILNNQQIITWTCDQCGKEKVESLNLGRGSYSLIPQLPTGWHEIEDKTYCPDHEIIIIVDNQNYKLPNMTPEEIKRHSTLGGG